MSNGLSRGKAVIQKVPGCELWCSHGLGDPDFIITGVGESPSAAFDSMKDGINEFYQERAIEGYRQVGPC
jgi:hypothetical protein